MTKKTKKNNPVEDIRNIEKSINGQLQQVEKTIETFENVRASLDPSAVERIEPMVDTLRRDCKVHRKNISKTLHSIEGIGRPKRVEQYMKVHQAGTDMYNHIDVIATATLPMAAEVMKDLEEGIDNATKR